MKLLTQKQALKSIIVLLSLVTTFHILVFAGVIPYSIVWAGKINTESEMRSFELVSMMANAFMISIFLLRGNYIPNKYSRKTLNVFIWFFTVLFALNTLGNLFAETSLELYCFTPLTLIAGLLCLRIVLEKNEQPREISEEKNSLEAR